MAHRIEVDDDVMAALKSRAEAFVDTPNSVLRRLLLDEVRKDEVQESQQMSTTLHAGGSEPGLVPAVRRGTPRALEQILQVAYLTCNSSRTRPEATHVVARHHGIAFQTVLDKYCRQLDLTAGEFDDLLGERGLSGLRRLLTNRFERHKDVITDVLG